ncbi:MAG: Ribonucleoside-diphosphate reductase NrdZ [candidate division WS2 bacterium ADurb.Bin280]|uniref:Ribonucleoside-diphosphate reductase NrdZ n=1 Tax=candidate division WS2 bacterium ADurb.Bin280 TaxID=1852829 RepID=A0A1V5SFH6_9BACT|nr:MAG: Ribonucleoside-diphosphate reductase NrdZ [candidate division WS2 bacterium ADurb.Bin280]
MQKSTFRPSKQAYNLLRCGGILGAKETASAMIERVANEVFSVEHIFKTSEKEKQGLVSSFMCLIDEKKIIPSTPILMNAGRFVNRPLSACISPPYEIMHELRKIKEYSADVHRMGMGTGYCFDESNDPVRTLEVLNSSAVRSSKDGKELRPVGNMATLSVRHKDIEKFILSKVKKKDEDWRFNISVLVDDAFMNSLHNGEKITLSDGKDVYADEIFKKIVYATHQCADPGLVFVDRMNDDNPSPKIGQYKTVAPCGEVGLLGGEFCQFIYINIGRFVTCDKKGNIDYSGLDEAVEIVTRALDNSLELSIARLDSKESKKIMMQKRKIGLGICGFADLLASLSLSYGEERSRILAENIMSFINYRSKLVSVDLARKRGSCLAMSSYGLSRYDDKPSYLEKKYAGKNTEKVTEAMWFELARDIKKHRFLRNLTTTALPPTGRSAQLIDATTGIEPFFSLIDYSGQIINSLKEELKSSGAYSPGVDLNIKKSGKICEDQAIPEAICSVYRTALEINYIDHLQIASSFQKYVDESISKTINVPEGIAEGDIGRIFMLAHELGLKGVTIYRSGSKSYEPRALSS